MSKQTKEQERRGKLYEGLMSYFDSMDPEELEKIIQERNDFYDNHKIQDEEWLKGWGKHAWIDAYLGLNAMRRVGVTLNEDQKTRVKELLEKDKTGEAQKIILDTIQHND